MTTITTNKIEMDNNHQNIDQLSQHLVEIASNAALKVGDMLAKASAEATAGDVNIETKSSFHDLVTKYDKESEQVITDYIFQKHPDSTIVGEEDGAKGNGSIHWYVDPIDGTSNFAAGIPFFCVSIGAALDDQLLAGVIYDPIRGELFSASMQGAYLNNEPIKSRGAETDAEAMLVTAFPSPHMGVSDDDFRLYSKMVRQFATVRRMGSAALTLAYVACGRIDVVFEPGINPWDVAAGMLIVEQAGGRYVAFGQRDGQTPQYPWMCPCVIATCPEFELEQSIMSTLLP